MPTKTTTATTLFFASFSLRASGASSSYDSATAAIGNTMARSDEAAAFFLAVYSAVREIPPGKVTTYGHIAKLRPRQVGVCLKHLSQDPDSRHNHDNVPWQRVINSKGLISPRSQPSGARNQAAALEAEGVEVSTGSLGELSVDFSQYGWFPRSLPSEADEFDDVDDEEDEDEDEP
ncbi:hypothetical protein PG984_005855 [Apiospora sp. TS-2023a]